MVHLEAGMPLFVWCTHRNHADAGHLLECLRMSGVTDGFSLAVFSAEDWDAAYSPWSAPNPADGGMFPGGGPETALRLQKELADAGRQGPFREVCLCGYSLAGLFVLWEGLQNKDIRGIVCGSGSLWYDGFAGFLSGVTPAGTKRIYLSLGGKEKNAADAMVRTVEERTREAAEILTEKPGVLRVRFVLNPGGHFADSGKRLAAGIRWMLEESRTAAEEKEI